VSDLSLIVRRTIRAPAERVFAAWTEPAQLQRWWGPAGVVCTGAEVDLRVGGRYRIGNRLPDGSQIWISGEFEQVVPPHRLVYTWRTEDDAPAERVTVRFESRDGATEVIVVHERIATAPLRDGHQQGWQGCLDGLVEYADRGTRSG
jgi:uncharacterized protein YndB with AHSA1/START domain